MASSTTDLCSLPAGQSPDGTHDFNAAGLASTLMALMGFTLAWAFIFTGARIYVNLRKLDWEASMNLRTARHIWDVRACWFDSIFAKGVFVSGFLLQLGAFCAKASILRLFHTLFTTHQSRTPMNIAIWVAFVLDFALYGAGIIVICYYETPRQGESWTAILDGRTTIPLPWWVAQSALIVTLDLFMFVLPLPIVMRLQISTRKRIELVAVFSAALLGITCSVASLVERVVIQSATDQTWISAILSLCSDLELNVAIIVGSAPGFSSYARAHLADSSVVRLLASAFTYSSYSRSKSRSRSDKNITEGSHNHGPRHYAGRLALAAPDGTFGPKDDDRHAFYALGDVESGRFVKTGATVDASGAQGETQAERIVMPHGRRGIVRTFGVQQSVSNVSAEQFV